MELDNVITNFNPQTRAQRQRGNQRHRNDQLYNNNDSTTTITRAYACAKMQPTCVPKDNQRKRQKVIAKDPEKIKESNPHVQKIATMQRAGKGQRAKGQPAWQKIKMQKVKSTCTGRPGRLYKKMQKMYKKGKRNIRYMFNGM